MKKSKVSEGILQYSLYMQQQMAINGLLSLEGYQYLAISYQPSPKAVEVSLRGLCDRCLSAVPDVVTNKATAIKVYLLGCVTI